MVEDRHRSGSNEDRLCFLVELADGIGKLVAFLALEQELSDGFTTQLVFGDCSSLGLFLDLVLVLVVDGTEAVARVPQ